ncbi:MAG TPA: hypothetical protein VGH12_02155 [Steroidobacteraceae bacterium]|jgi:hypothetical protein
MRKLILAAALSVSAALAFSSPVLAQADPSMNQIYDAAAAGHLDQAQQMITTVLADHPNSAKAHYVQAELYAKEGKASMARVELGIAERLSPGLPSFNPRSVQELKSQLGLSASERGLARPVVSDAPRTGGFPWGALLIGVVVVGLLMLIFRRRNTYNSYPPGAGPGMGGAPGGAPGAYGPGYGPAPMGGGIGSGIAGGLASGLAVGAGVVAGEELAHHFLDGGRRDGGVIPAADAAEAPMSNNDMGGADFGANDSSSWDDGGGFGGGGGGGDDWS